MIFNSSMYINYNNVLIFHTILCICALLDTKLLQKQRRNGDFYMRNVICFHSPNEDNAYLSNWFLSNFEVNNIPFTSMEQYMMYQKAIIFNDKTIAAQILETSDFGKIKALGRAVKNYNDVYWNGIRQIVVYKGLVEKFLQNEPLKKQLLSTAPHILAECAVHDKIWGIGLSMKDDKRFDMNQWQGQNLLGFSLMMVRDFLS